MQPDGKTLSILKAGWDGILDLVYPPRCLLCGQLDRPAVCEECAATFEPVPEPVCPRCGRPVVEEGASCRHCREHLRVRGAGAREPADTGWAFDAARGCAIYEGAMRHGIHRLKYDGAELLGEPLGAYLANRCVVDGLLPPETLHRIGAVVPVPMHPSRERTRGYNQARLLAKPVAEMLGVSLLPAEVLRRVRKTAPQVGLGGEERQRNLREAFAVANHSAASATVSGRDLLLIDDVFTTGATADACARALKEAGARSVIVVTLAAGG